MKSGLCVALAIVVAGWIGAAQAEPVVLSGTIGNAPVIVDQTADIKNSLERTTMGAFSYAGQVCISVQRVYVHDKIFDEWTEKFVENAKKLKNALFLLG